MYITKFYCINYAVINFVKNFNDTIKNKMKIKKHIDRMDIKFN